ncbi:MAG: quinol:cytochrome C oxidoreductase [Flavobacteriales bacterium]|nr:quinol:cytochrome C oxidoreductase [Flavobacteriales bacterium]
MAIGLVSIIAAFASDPHQAWANLLVDNFFFLAIALFGTFFIAFQYLTESGWSAVIKRIPEAMAQYLYIGGPLFLIVIFAGNHNIFHWMDHELFEEGSPHFDKIIAGKEAFLNPVFFYVRSVIYIAGWIVGTYFLRKYSLQEDLQGGLKWHKKSIKASAGFVVFFAVSTSIAAWDWIMSIDAHWFSTLFGWYVFLGFWVSGTTFALLFTIYLKRKGYLQEVNENHLHDMGKWMFATSMVWAYLWVSQFLLIWYANIPEEVTYYQFRIEEYALPFFGMVIVNFFLPFFVLMSRDAKRHTGLLTMVGGIIFLGHWYDVQMMVIPGIVQEHGHIGFAEWGMFLGFLGLFLFVVQNALAKAPMVVKNHPFLEESLHHHY